MSGHKNPTVFGVRKLACALIRSSLLRRGSAREAASRSESGSKLSHFK